MPQTPARRRRRIRRTVAATSLAAFALTWGVIAGTGSMGASTPTTASGRGDGAVTPYGDSQEDLGAGSSQSQAQPSDLTTRQS